MHRGAEGFAWGEKARLTSDVGGCPPESCGGGERAIRRHTMTDRSGNDWSHFTERRSLVLWDRGFRAPKAVEGRATTVSGPLQGGEDLEATFVRQLSVHRMDTGRTHTCSAKRARPPTWGAGRFGTQVEVAPRVVHCTREP